MDPSTALRHLRAAVADQRRVLAAADLDAPVPACPGWTLHDLASHVTENHRWARGALVEGHPDVDPPPAPRGRAALLAWFDEGAGALLDLLAGTDPDTPCWTFGAKPSLAGFWFRRLAHEHTVHARDARDAAGPAGDDPPRDCGLDPELALDGVDEVVRMFFPRQVRLRRIEPLTRSLALAPDEAGAGRGWLLAGDGVGALAAPPGATVAGPAEAVYLLLWRRTGLDDARLALTGDRAAAESVLGTAIVP